MHVCMYVCTSRRNPSIYTIRYGFVFLNACTLVLLLFTHTCIRQVLIARATPDHLVRPEWESRIDAIQAERARKGLPPAMGERYKFNVPAEYNQVRW